VEAREMRVAKMMVAVFMVINVGIEIGEWCALVEWVVVWI